MGGRRHASQSKNNLISNVIHPGVGLGVGGWGGLTPGLFLGSRVVQIFSHVAKNKKEGQPIY